MRKPRFWPTVLLAMAITSGPMVLSGCYGQVRYYDSEYGVYHPWNHQEGLYYGRWENETRRRHMNFRDRSQDEQRQYWEWRHNHDNDRH